MRIKDSTFAISNQKSLGVFGDAALRYAESDLHVLPLEQGTKRPAALTVNGVFAATTNAEQIRRWWSVNPMYNVGIATGASDLCVLDEDGYQGQVSLAVLEAELGKLPPTTTQITPGKVVGGQHTGKGRHLIFKGIKGLQSPVGVVAGVDIKAGGGLIVVSPSVHPDGTGTYEFAPGCSFDDIAPVALPAPWVEFLQVACSKQQDKNYYNRAEAKVITVLERLAEVQAKFIAHLEGMLPPLPSKNEAATF